MFNIDFIAPHADDPVNLLTTGRIQIGEYTESFQASISFWSKDQYRKHWFQSIKYIVDGHPKSCLITSMVDPIITYYYLIWWPMYRVNDQVLFQNHLLFFEKLSEPFDIEQPHKSVHERRTVTEEGEHISEWNIHISYFEEYLKMNSY